WLVFLFFLPGVLDALALQGLLAPVQGLVDRLLGFLPNLLAAALILAFGWFGARIVRNIVTNLLTSLGADRFSKDVGLAGVLGERPVSGLVGLIVYVLVLVPVVVAALNALRLEAVTEPTSAMLTTILAALPAIFAALLLLAVAYVVGRLVAALAVDLLHRVGFDALPARLGLGGLAPGGRAAPATEAPDGPTGAAAGPAQAPAGRSLSDVAGWLILTVVMLFAAIEAADLLGFNQIALLMTNFVSFLGQIVLGLAIFGAGLYLAGAASRQILVSGTPQAPALAAAARVAIVVLGATMGLRQLGLADEIITLAFGLTLGAVAVAAAIAFGLGGRDMARALLEQWHRSLGSGSNRPPAGS
ncbi:MAG TPA: mechanosensitive ion channel, partial [Bacillota bacterium]